MRRAIILLLASLTPAFSDDVQILRTPHGPVRWLETKSQTSSDGPGHATLQGVPTTDEIQNMDAYAEQAPALIYEYVPEAHRGPDLLKNLDLAVAGWLRSTRPGRESAERVTRIIAFAYGRKCIADLKVRWAIVATDHGMDVALVKDTPHPGNASAFVWEFPYWGIRQQIEHRNSDLVQTMYVSFKEGLAKNEAQ